MKVREERRIAGVKCKQEGRSEELLLVKESGKKQEDRVRRVS